MTAKFPDEDREAFLAAMADVKRRRDSLHHPPSHRAPPPHPLQREADERAVLDALAHGPVEPDPTEAIESLAYRAPGIQDGVWRRLRRGQYRIGAELDLHGLNRERARNAVTLFLTDCRDRGVNCVRIIHGKGLGSPNSGPVLRTLLDGWLRRRNDVVAFSSARPHDGGTGACYVLLRAR